MVHSMATATADQPRKALIADDVSVNRLILSKIVTRMGLLVDEAADGAEAVALVSRSLHTRPYAFVLLDVVMPNLDGFEAALAIRALEATAYRDNLHSGPDGAGDEVPSRPAKQRRLAEISTTGKASDASGSIAKAPATTTEDTAQVPAIGSAPDTPRVPIFAVTCSTDDELWQRPVLHDRCASPAARAGATPWQLCGMDGLVPKPLTAAQLQTALERVLDPAAPSPTSSTTTAVIPAIAGLSGSTVRTVRRSSVPASVRGSAGDGAHAGMRAAPVGLAAAAVAGSHHVALTAALPTNDICPGLLAPIVQATSSGTSAGSVLALQSGTCTASSPAR